MTFKGPTDNGFEGVTPETRRVLVSTASAVTLFCVGPYPLIWTESYMPYVLEGS